MDRSLSKHTILYYDTEIQPHNTPIKQSGVNRAFSLEECVNETHKEQVLRFNYLYKKILQELKLFFVCCSSVCKYKVMVFNVSETVV